MSPFRFILKSLWHDRAIHLLTACGATLATAVLVGAMLLGDSMRGSLHDLALRRLGNIDTALVSERFFHPDFLPTGIGALPEPFVSTLPAIILPVAVITEENGELDRYIGDAQIVTMDWVEGSFSINGALADRLGMTAGGGQLLLRLERPQAVIADSALGRRTDTLLRMPVTVQRILRNRDFSLETNQIPKPTVYVPLSWLQERLGMPGKVNTMLFLTADEKTVSTEEQRRELRKLFRFPLDDLGIAVDQEKGFMHFKSESMLFNAAQTKCLATALGHEAEPYLVYLAESLYSAKRETRAPYSTICAIDHSFDGVVVGDEEMLVNEWLAEQIKVQISDIVEVTYFEPESTRGQTRTKKALFTIAGVIPMEGLAGDTRLVPELKGITDEKSIAEWNPPFPFDAKKISPRDEEYWERYKALPKAFVSLNTGRKLWGSRFGDTTGFITSTKHGTSRLLTVETAAGAVDGGFIPPIRPVKEAALVAASGTTPFHILFLMMSFFIIAAALLLLGLLIRLGIDRRERQLGTMLSIGITIRTLEWLLAVEGMCVVFVGSLLGIPLGIQYAAILIHVLNTWWIDAIVIPFMTLHVTPISIMIGLLGGLLLSMLVIPGAIRAKLRYPARVLMTGTTEVLPIPSHKLTTREQVGRVFTLLLIVVMLIMLLVFGGIQRDSMAAAGYFFGAGAILTLLGLMRLMYRFHRVAGEITSNTGLAISNARRHPIRSLLCAALVAQAVFLILAVGAFRLDSSTVATGRDSGAGGFFKVLETALPVYHDLGLPQGREAVGFQSEEQKLIGYGGINIYSFKANNGDTADCQNLFQTARPRMLGVPHHFCRRGGFRFDKTIHPIDNPWMLLEEPQSDNAVPVILDSATAMYAMHLNEGVGQEFTIDSVRYRVVALLSNSIFQGDVLLADSRFRAIFPEESGYRFFLIEDTSVRGGSTAHGSEIAANVDGALVRTLADYGVRDESVRDRLGRFFSVQNTYLSCFQSLGTIGLLFGLVGLAIVQYRNVRERRQEIALLRVCGFSTPSIIALVGTEGIYLLFHGALIGLAAALLTVLPFLGAVSSAISLLGTFVALMAALLVVGLTANLLAARTAARIPPGMLLRESD